MPFVGAALQTCKAVATCPASDRLPSASCKVAFHKLDGLEYFGRLAGMTGHLPRLFHMALGQNTEPAMREQGRFLKAPWLVIQPLDVCNVPRRCPLFAAMLPFWKEAACEDSLQPCLDVELLAAQCTNAGAAVDCRPTPNFQAYWHPPPQQPECRLRPQS